MKSNLAVAVFSQFANGKDVFCDYLIKKLNERALSGIWQKASFAAGVKKAFMDSTLVDIEWLEKWKRIDEPPPGFKNPVRQCLQFIGDGFRKHIKDDIWIQRCFGAPGQKIIADGRYWVNEAKFIYENGGTNILLYRPGFLNDDSNESESQIRAALDWAIKNNLPEGIIDQNQQLPLCMKYFSLYIKNDGEIVDLYKKIDKIVIDYIEGKYHESY